jgi:hypothetical protein
VKIFTTRKQCEMILSCLYERMQNLPTSELPEYNKLCTRLVNILELQCKEDDSHYNEKKSRTT